MIIFRRSSMRYKLLGITLLGVLVSTLFVFIGIYIYEIATYEKRITQEMTETATFVSSNSGAALAFKDSKTAQEILATMRALPAVELAALYTLNGTVLASYSREDQKMGPPLARPWPDGLRFKGRDLELIWPVSEKGRHLGTLYLLGDTATMRARLMDYTGILAVILFAITGSAFFLERVLASWISIPVLRLSRAAGKIASGDLSTRVPVDSQVGSKDEVNQLAESFNHMSEELSALVNQEREARNDAEEAVRARDDFLSIAAHELKTPLTPMKMHLHIIKKYLKEIDASVLRSKELVEIIGKSDRQLERIVRLVDDLLDVARITKGKLSLNLEQCDFGELVRGVMEQYQEAVKSSGCTLTLEVPDGIVGKCDRLRFEQVVVNLLTNALKYGANQPLAIRLSQDAEHVKLTVRDHGIGISEVDQGKIFERFARAVPFTAYGGLGLGLYISRQIVDAHHGKISVESQSGKGSIFTVEIPLKPRLQ